mmetsp:Transcript_28451/g.50867  ORF Transcript_28451/g.50867 Transcript_28451/m.50867 type:complete len:85 (-) Transcript_28451:210-464(-)
MSEFAFVCSVPDTTHEELAQSSEPWVKLGISSEVADSGKKTLQKQFRASSEGKETTSEAGQVGSSGAVHRLRRSVCKTKRLKKN